MDKSKYQVVVFITEWCPYCKQMRDNVWPDEKVTKAISSYHGSKPAFITCNKPQNRHLVDEFNIERYPTVVIMDEDHNIKRQAHNMQSEELVSFLEEFND